MSDYLSYSTTEAAQLAHGDGCNLAVFGPGDVRVWLGDGPAPWASTESTNRTITVDEYVARFTDAEQAAFVALAAKGDVTANSLHFRLSTRQAVNLDSASVSAGLDYLVSKYVIAANRKAEILA
jgi:hypothetical protein